MADTDIPRGRVVRAFQGGLTYEVQAPPLGGPIAIQLDLVTIKNGELISVPFAAEHFGQLRAADFDTAKRIINWDLEFGKRLLQLPASEDMVCIAPGCGKMIVAQGTPVQRLLGPDPSGVEETSMVWNPCQVSTIDDGKPTLLHMRAGGCCAKERCTVRASDRLHKYAAMVTHASNPDGLTAPLRLGIACGLCGTILDKPEERVPCADGPYCEWYCCTEHRDKAEPAHALAAAHTREVDSKWRTCAGCNKPGLKLQHCSGCRSVYYCDAACQRAHWPSHKPVCKKR